ncbi:LysE family translocator [Streptomyces sp. NPDC002790]|uniref:LysE family translocator n=1 Tax=Streptomyces sp. NPDC002790 TaxID=3154431 RepID=UPI003330037B
MSSASLLGWMLVALLGVMTPGLDTMLVLRHTMLGGRRAGLTVIAGITLGCLAWGTASIVGLSALLTASQLAYNVVRVLGAAYLLWLGGSALWRTLPRNRSAAAVGEQDEAPATTGALAALRAGMVTNLLNPKVGVFYMSVLPQFMPHGPSSGAWGFLLVAIHLTVGVLWYSPLVWAASKARRLLLRQRVKRWLDRISAGVLVGLGLKLATEAR